MGKDRSKGRQRGNGDGAVIRLPDGRYRALVAVDRYTVWEDGIPKERRKTRSRVCETKHEANAAIGDLRAEYEMEKNGGRAPGVTPTFQELVDQWEEYYEPLVKPGTMTCYKSALSYILAGLGTERMSRISIDDLQAALDAIPHGRRTKENAKTACNLVYAYGIPRGLTGGTLNLGHYLRVNYDKSDNAIKRESLTDDELAALFALADSGDEDAKAICTLCLMGWRPDEFLNLRIENVDLDKRYIVGGSKTDAGIDRPVPIHPRVYPYIVDAIGDRESGYIYGNPKHGGGKRTLKKWTNYRFYPCLERAGIENPMVKAGGGTERHRITPHSCRHTFARLLKRVNAPVETKLDVIGHTDEDQLRDYIDSTLPERKSLIDSIQIPEKKEKGSDIA